MDDALDLLAATAEFAADLGLTEVRTVLAGEVERIRRGEVRVVALGPTSAGKTTTLLSLVGDAGTAGGRAILPVGVRPATAHIIELEYAEAGFEATLLQEDGVATFVSNPVALRAAIEEARAPLRRVQVRLFSPALRSGLTLIDCPGFGADSGDAAGHLAGEALTQADIVLFHVRSTRGLGPCLPALAAFLEKDPFPEAREARLLIVFTDARGLGREDELLDGLEARLGFRPRHCWVGRPGEVIDLQATLERLRADPTVVAPPAQRTAALVTGFAIPILQRRCDGLLEAADGGSDQAERTEEFIAHVRASQRSITAAGKDFRKLSTKSLKQIARARHGAVGADISRLIDGMTVGDRFVWSGFRDDICATIEVDLVNGYSTAASEALEQHARDLAEHLGEELDRLDQRVRQALPVGETPGFDQLKREGRNLAVERGAARGMAYLVRLGGVGGAKMGTINLARKLAAWFYRLGGKDKRAPAELIRRGIPRAVGRLGTAMKHLSKRMWIIDVVVELWDMLVVPLKSKKTLRKFKERALDSWLNGPDRTLWMRLRRKGVEKGTLDLAEELTALIWHGTEVEKDGSVTKVPGISELVSKVTDELAALADELEREVELTRNAVHEADGRTEMLSALASRSDRLSKTYPPKGPHVP